jgi:hypothetical protein
MKFARMFLTITSLGLFGSCDNSVPDAITMGTSNTPTSADQQQGQDLASTVTGDLSSVLTGLGFCEPAQTLIAPSFTRSTNVAIDYDGDPYAYAVDGHGRDYSANGGIGLGNFGIDTTAGIRTLTDPLTAHAGQYYVSQTAGKVNGKYVDAKNYAYVVMSRDQMRTSGVKLGDWATVTNDATGQTVWARVEDVGPANNGNEISESAADALGLQYSKNGADGSVSVQAFAGTANIQGDCSDKKSNARTQTTSS